MLKVARAVDVYPAAEQTGSDFFARLGPEMVEIGLDVLGHYGLELFGLPVPSVGRNRRRSASLHGLFGVVAF